MENTRFISKKHFIFLSERNYKNCKIGLAVGLIMGGITAVSLGAYGLLRAGSLNNFGATRSIVVIVLGSVGTIGGIGGSTYIGRNKKGNLPKVPASSLDNERPVSQGSQSEKETSEEVSGQTDTEEWGMERSRETEQRLRREEEVIEKQRAEGQSKTRVETEKAKIQARAEEQEKAAVEAQEKETQKREGDQKNREKVETEQRLRREKEATEKRRVEAQEKATRTAKLQRSYQTAPIIGAHTMNTNTPGSSKGVSSQTRSVEEILVKEGSELTAKLEELQKKQKEAQEDWAKQTEQKTKAEETTKKNEEQEKAAKLARKQEEEKERAIQRAENKAKDEEWKKKAAEGHDKLTLKWKKEDEQREKARAVESARKVEEEKKAEAARKIAAENEKKKEEEDRKKILAEIDERNKALEEASEKRWAEQAAKSEERTQAYIKARAEEKEKEKIRSAERAEAERKEKIKGMVQKSSSLDEVFETILSIKYPKEIFSLLRTFRSMHPEVRLSPKNEVQRAIAEDSTHDKLRNSSFHEMLRERNLENDGPFIDSCYDLAYRLLHPYIYRVSSTTVKASEYVLNFVWINLNPQDREKDEAENIFGKGNNTFENAECIKHPDELRAMEGRESSMGGQELEDWQQVKQTFTYKLSRWADLHPGVQMNLWYDSALVTQRAQEQTNQMMKAIRASRGLDLRMIDIHQFPSIGEFRHLYHPGVNVYNKADNTKARIPGYYMNRGVEIQEDLRFCVVSDIDIEPMSPEHLFDDRTLQYLLNSHTGGYVFNPKGHKGLENSFSIFNTRIPSLIEIHKKHLLDRQSKKLAKIQHYPRGEGNFNDTLSVGAQTVYDGYHEFAREIEGKKEKGALLPNRKVVECPDSQFSTRTFSSEDFQKEKFRFIKGDPVPYTVLGRAYEYGEEVQLFKEWKSEPLPALYHFL